MNRFFFYFEVKNRLLFFLIFFFRFFFSKIFVFLSFDFGVKKSISGAKNRLLSIFFRFLAKKSIVFRIARDSTLPLHPSPSPPKKMKKVKSSQKAIKIKKVSKSCRICFYVDIKKTIFEFFWVFFSRLPKMVPLPPPPKGVSQ